MIRRDKTPRKMTDQVEFSPDPLRLGRSFNGGKTESVFYLSPMVKKEMEIES
jgi:hypothetical protein